MPSFILHVFSPNLGRPSLLGADRCVPGATGRGGRIIPPNKKTYQQDPANYREALREMQLDEAEGADIMMVHPPLAPSPHHRGA